MTVKKIGTLGKKLSRGLSGLFRKKSSNSGENAVIETVSPSDKQEKRKSLRKSLLILIGRNSENDVNICDATPITDTTSFDEESVENNENLEKVAVDHDDNSGSSEIQSSADIVNVVKPAETVDIKIPIYVPHDIDEYDIVNVAEDKSTKPVSEIPKLSTQEVPMNRITDNRNQSVPNNKRWIDDIQYLPCPEFCVCYVCKNISNNPVINNSKPVDCDDLWKGTNIAKNKPKIQRHTSVNGVLRKRLSKRFSVNYGAGTVSTIVDWE